MRFSTSHTRFSGILVFLAASGLVLAQQTAPGGWRRANDAPPQAQRQQQDPQMDPSTPVDRSDQYGQQQQVDPNGPPPNPAYQDQQPPDQRSMNQQPIRPSYGLPAQVTLKPNTYVTVRINQPLSSDHNQPGDTFSATLMQPVVADGVVIAQRGQTIYGRVAVAEKAHSGKDSRLGLELTSMTLADGTQEPIHTQLIAHTGPHTPGSVEAGTIVGTTAVGAAVGGAVGWGTGAGIGAGVGAAAGIIGVLLTHNHETRLYPETVLTFAMTSPVTVATGNAPQAYRFVGPDDYDRPNMQYNMRPAPPRTVVAAPYAYPYPYYGGYYGYGYPYYWGPSVVIGGGWGWYGGYRGGYYRGGGFYRHR